VARTSPTARPTDDQQRFSRAQETGQPANLQSQVERLVGLLLDDPDARRERKKLVRSLREAPGLQALPARRLHLRKGLIQEAVLAVLGEVQEPLRPCDIRDAVQDRVGRPVAYDTISSLLSVAARDAVSKITRVSPGLDTSKL
jgi:hypothetical protein